MLYQLTLDADGEVAKAARETSAGLPDGVLLKVLAEPLDPRVLDLFAELCLPRPAAVEVILINRVTDDATVLYVTRNAGERELEIVAANEARLVRAPQIIEALYLNPKARMSTVDRVMEMAARRGLRLEGIPAFDEAMAALGLAPSIGPSSSPGAEALTPPAAADASFEEMLTLGADLQPGELDPANLVDDSTDERQQRLQALTPSAKVRLATLGNQFHRQVLVQDSNRVVAMAVIKSPALTDMEVQRIAASRTVLDDVIRYIANSKDWLKNYGVKKSLANNPKCPLGISVRLLTHLHPGDLRQIAKSRNIPAALRTAATQLDNQRRR